MQITVGELVAIITAAGALVGIIINGMAARHAQKVTADQLYAQLCKDLQTELDKRDARIAALEAALGIRDARIAELERRVRELEEENAKLREELETKATRRRVVA